MFLALAALTLAGSLSACCTTGAVVRAARGSEQLIAVDAVRVTEGGGLELELTWLPGTLSKRAGRLSVAAERLAAAHADGTARLPAASIAEYRGEAAAPGRELETAQLGFDFGWEPDELAALRPPRGKEQALFHQEHVFTWRGPVRVAHVRPDGAGGYSVAVLELEPREHRRRPFLYALVPVTAALDFALQPLLAGFVVGLGGLAL